MASRGPYIGRAYTEELGMVYVFADDDNKDMFFVEATRSDDTRYLARSRVKFRK